MLRRRDLKLRSSSVLPALTVHISAAFTAFLRKWKYTSMPPYSPSLSNTPIKWQIARLSKKIRSLLLMNSCSFAG